MNEDHQRLADQFVKSLRLWGGWEAATTGNQDYLTTPASNLASNLYLNHAPDPVGNYRSREEEWVQMLHLSRTFVNSCLVQEVYHVTGDFELLWLMETVESPIEALVLMSLILCAREYRIGVKVSWTKKSRVDERNEDFELSRDFTLGKRQTTLEIRPQAKLGDHRVDFLLSYYGSEFAQQRDKQQPNSNDLQEIHLDKKMIVECDGHDFHEKTKEQATRDKVRDRNLQSLGYPVYRYSGSEIYRDVFRSTVEVLRVLTGLDYTKDWDHFKKAKRIV